MGYIKIKVMNDVALEYLLFDIEEQKKFTEIENRIKVLAKMIEKSKKELETLRNVSKR